MEGHFAIVGNMEAAVGIVAEEYSLVGTVVLDIAVFEEFESTAVGN